MSNSKILIFLYLLFSCSSFDDESPKQPSNLKGYFSVKNDIPQIKLTWERPIGNDIKKYIIERETIDSLNDSLIIVVDSDKQFYIDTKIKWMENFTYKIRAEGFNDKISDESNSINVFCHTASGFWVVSGDTARFCVSFDDFSVSNGFKIHSYRSDTLVQSFFGPFFLDSITWQSTGQMIKSKIFMDSSYNSYTDINLTNLDTIINEMDTTLTIYDTVTIVELVIDTNAITQPPESFQMDLSSPSGGLITFLSESIQPIELFYDQKRCNGRKLFP